MTKTISEQAMEMYQRKAYKTLKLFKKAKKKSWSVLGINPEMEALIMKGGDTIYGNKGTFDLQNILIYKHREIDAVLGTVSYPTMAQISGIERHEKFRADPRFPLMQKMQQMKRLREILAGPAGLPIFA